jgi:alpha-D-xyloside xylohydrolase
MYPLFETTAVYKGQRATTDQKRVVILSRSAFAGQQRNGSISWSGDVTANWETLRRQIPAGLSFSMSGLPYWTTDIGGFFRPDDQYTSDSYHELLIRWFEFGIFCPIFRIHGFHSETEIWKYGPEVEQILRQYDILRYRLLPYIYSAAWGVTNRGDTFMRALPLEFPDQPRLQNIKDQFVFGPSLLINPVTQEGATERDVLLPAGDNWVDFWTGQRQEGGQTIKASVRLDRIPIYVRGGSIVAFGPEVQSAEDSWGPLEIRVYPGKNADFELYEDQGDGYGYEHGQRATIPFHWDDRRELLIIGSTKGSFQGMRNHHTFRVVRVGFEHGIGIHEDGNSARELEYLGHEITLRLPSSH